LSARGLKGFERGRLVFKEVQFRSCVTLGALYIWGPTHLGGNQCFFSGNQASAVFFSGDQASAVASGGWPCSGIFGRNYSHLLQK
jgi:hypothetical protein